jgi:hypothetical protein
MNDLSYNDLFEAGEQIDTEEMIAAILFDKFGVNEDDAQAASQEILLAIVAKFRPEFVEKV